MVRYTHFLALVLVCISTFSTGQASANTVQADLNSDAFKAQFDATHSSSKINFSASFMLTDDNGNLAAVGAYTRGQFSSLSNTTGGLGARFYYADPEFSNDFQALGLGGHVDFAITAVSGLSLGAELYYAPSIVVSKDVDGFLDFTFRVNYQLFENGTVYLGLRETQADYENGGDYTFDDGIHFGFKLDI